MAWIIGVVIFAALVIAAAHSNSKSERKRRVTLRNYARSNGWSYLDEDDRLCRWWTRPPFGEGSDRRCMNALSGQFRNHPMLAFDYTYTPPRGDPTADKRHYRVCSLGLPVALPNLEVTPAPSFSAARHLLGMHDVRLESEEFNRRFRVHADDAKFAYDVLTPRTVQTLLASAPYAWRIDDGTIVSWAEGANEVSDLIQRLTMLASVVEGTPEFVWHDHSVPPGPAATNSEHAGPRHAEVGRTTASFTRGQHEAPRRL